MPHLITESAGKIEIYYEEQGEGDPVVLIGGVSSTAEVWEHQTRALAAQHRVLCPDNRGSGRTRVPEDDGVRTMERFAGDVLALLDGLELERVHLVGASMGGMIVQQFAVEHPGRLRSLVVACSHPGGALAVAPSPEAVAKLVQGQMEGASPEAERAGLEVVFHPDSLVQRPGLVEWYSAGKKRLPHTPQELQRRTEAVGGFDVSERLRELRVPTLVLTGSDDRIVPPENSRRIAAAIPGAELVVVEGTGHAFFIEKAEDANRALLAFFARH